MSEAGIVVNLVFMFLNLLPILRSTAAASSPACCRAAPAWQYAKLEPWGLPLLLLLLVTNVLNFVLEPLVGASDALIRRSCFDDVRNTGALRHAPDRQPAPGHYTAC